MKKIIGFRLEEDIYRKLKLYCINNNTNIQKLFESFVNNLLENKTNYINNSKKEKIKNLIEEYTNKIIELYK